MSLGSLRGVVEVAESKAAIAVSSACWWSSCQQKCLLCLNKGEVDIDPDVCRWPMPASYWTLDSPKEKLGVAFSNTRIFLR